MSKILFNKELSGENYSENKKSIKEPQSKIEIEQPNVNTNKTIPNLFLGRTENEAQNSSFPDWDIIPKNRFINPRIKKN